MRWEDEHERAQSTRTANVICMKWGRLYGPEWVNKLYGGVSRNTLWNVRFVCLTDDRSGIRSGVECLPLPPLPLDTPKFYRGHRDAASGASTDPWWNKLSAFGDLYDLTGMTLYLDLDVLAVANIDDLFRHPGRFCMMSVWDADRFAAPVGNSSVVRFFAGREKNVLDTFLSRPFSEWQARFNGSQQKFLSAHIGAVTFFPRDWCASFKDCMPRNALLRRFSTPIIPDSAKLVIFYGAHTPHAAMRGEMEPAKKKLAGRRLRASLFKRKFRPPAWIGEHWTA